VEGEKQKLDPDIAKQQLANDHPVMVAWEKFKVTTEYKNCRKWGKKGVLQGAMWRCFLEGWMARSKSSSNEPKKEE